MLEKMGVLGDPRVETFGVRGVSVLQKMGLLGDSGGVRYLQNGIIGGTHCWKMGGSPSSLPPRFGLRSALAEIFLLRTGILGGFLAGSPPFSPPPNPLFFLLNSRCRIKR